MKSEKMDTRESVGPVLEAGEAARAVVQAIREMNPKAVIQDRGSYLRVLVPGRCIVTREAIERILGRPFQLPGDLEILMPSFKGALTMTEGQAAWAFKGAA